MKYVLYLRKSNEKKLREEELSIDVQRTACHQWIKKREDNNKYQTVEYVEIISGTNRDGKDLSGRAQLLNALAELEKGDVFLVAKRERLTREPMLNMMIENIIIDAKAEFASADGSMEGNEPNDILMRMILDAFAKYEALMISYRTKHALARKKALGERTGYVPYGMKCVAKLVVDGKPQPTKLEKCPKEQKILKEMKALRNSGLSFRAIEIQMKKNGTLNRDGHSWSHSAISRVIKNYSA